MILSNLSTHPNIKPEKDELNRFEISEQYTNIKLFEQRIKEAEAEIRRLRKQQAGDKFDPAYIDTDDRVMIIEDLLRTGSPVSKAFDRHELKNKYCKEWAKRTIRYAPNKKHLGKALERLLNGGQSTSLELINKQKVLDQESIGKSSTYGAALNNLKKQFKLSQRLQDKDDHIAKMDITISDKDREIVLLRQELLGKKSIDWQSEAIALKKLGMKVSHIAEKVGMTRSLVSTYLNKPSKKAILQEAN
jgi:hypothetical protein